MASVINFNIIINYILFRDLYAYYNIYLVQNDFHKDYKRLFDDAISYGTNYN